MTARDAGGIASRAMAIYLATICFREIVVLPPLLELFGTRSRYYTPPSPISLFTSILLPVIYGMAAILLWVKAGDFWPADRELKDSTMDSTAWTQLACIFIGLYYLMFYGVHAVYDFV